MSGIFIGTSGWNYDHWKNDFYAGVKRADWLRHYAGQFNAVEVNATFYRLQKPETLQRWHDETPEHFHFAIKGNRYLTHNKKLTDPDEPIELERRNAAPLGHKLAAVLWQLPGNFHKNIERLQTFCKALLVWGDVRHAIEFRHPSWFDRTTAAYLREFGIANCQSDAADWPLWPAVTTNLVYIRLHGHTRAYASAYRRDALQRWAESINTWRRAGRTVHVYLDNDAEGAAPRDALKLAAMVEEKYRA